MERNNGTAVMRFLDWQWESCWCMEWRGRNIVDTELYNEMYFLEYSSDGCGTRWNFLAEIDDEIDVDDTITWYIIEMCFENITLDD